ncbi:hypothetical protein CPC08DRAFT_763832 [Agrocybe pediades]|nr:hypothetical protein CPC08DRAFT_763832 [Agrocybe pediades]
MHTPISTLHDELLWAIFTESAEFPDILTPADERPIITVRHCSQVSQQWRRILLSSPSIWARMIDLDFLGQRSGDWRAEVVSRAGQAPLWVYGLMRRRMVSFFLPLLQNNWHRVEAIGLADDLSSLSLQDRQAMWDCLKKPAPSLRRFIFQLCEEDVDLPNPLFGHDAPVLQDLHFASPVYKIEPIAPWAHNISGISFSTAFSTSEVLEGLKHMPQLDFVNISVEETTHPIDSAAIIHLPHLQLLQVRGDMLCVAIILSSITSSRDCCLCVWISAERGLPFDKAEYEQYERASIKFIIPYFSLHPPSIVNVRYSLSGNCVNLVHGAPANKLRFDIPVAAQSIQSSTILKVLKEIDGLSNVKELRLGLWMDYSALRNPDLVSALDVFSSITTLTTIDHVLECFLNHVSFINECLPNLNILSILPYTPRPKPEDPAHHRFLRRRKAIGLPISVLEIHLKPLYDVDYLEEHSGLVVRGFYSDQCLGEYRCGEGHPEELRFATKKERLGLLRN